MAIPLRSAIHSRLVFIDELSGASQAGAFDADPGGPVGYVLNLAAASGFASTQNRVKAPVYKNTRRNYQSVLGKVLAQGKTPFQLDYKTSGRLLKIAHGTSGYNRIAYTATSLHQFFTPTSPDAVPGSCQLQEDFTTASLVCLRHRGIAVNGVDFSYSPDGVASLGVDFLGVGDELATQLVASPTDEGYQATNVFNGNAILNQIGLVGLTAGSFGFTYGVQRVDAAFTGGKGAGLTFGTIALTGNISLPMAVTSAGGVEADLTFYNYAINNTSIPLEVSWAPGPLATADSWCRIQAPSTFFERNFPKPGGQGGIIINQKFHAESFQSLDNIAAEMIVPTRAATFNVDATHFNFQVNVDALGVITVALTQGGARTLAQVVTDLNANGTLTARATVDTYAGRLRITSKQTGGTGTASTVQIVFGGANDSSTLFGYTASQTYTGFSNCPYLITIFNSLTANY